MFREAGKDFWDDSGFNQALVSKYSREILAPRVRDMDEVGAIKSIDLCCLEWIGW